MSETATIKVWHGWGDKKPAREPDHKGQVQIYRGEWWGNNYPTRPAKEAHQWYLSEDVAYSSPPLSWWVEADEPVSLFIHTNDSYHSPGDWGRPVEAGLVFGPDIRSDEPFGCEVWGRVVCWVAERDSR